MPSALVDIYCEDGTFLKTVRSFYIKGDIEHSRVQASSRDEATYAKEFVVTSKANNDCLISKSDYKNVIYGILLTRKKKDSDDIDDNLPFSVSESIEGLESTIDAAVRGVKEELGCVIDPSKFTQTGRNKFVLMVSAAAKAKVIDLYRKLLPITEIYDVQWVSTSSSRSSRTFPTNITNVVTDTDIQQYDLIPFIELAHKSIKGTETPLKLTSGLTFTPADESYKHASYKGPYVPPSSSSSSKTQEMGRFVPPEKTEVTWPTELENETKDAYVKRVVGSAPGRNMTATRAYAAANTKLKGGRTIRRKKSKRSKKQGTLKRGVRR